MFSEKTSSNKDNNSGNTSKFLQIMNIFGRGETNVTSQMVSQDLNISLNNASRRLKILMAREWLKRKKNPDPNVRNGHVYNLRKEGLETLRRMEERGLNYPYKYTVSHLMNLADINKIKIDLKEFSQKL